MQKNLPPKKIGAKICIEPPIWKNSTENNLPPKKFGAKFLHRTTDLKELYWKQSASEKNLARNFCIEPPILKNSTYILFYNKFFIHCCFGHKNLANFLTNRSKVTNYIKINFWLLLTSIVVDVFLSRSVTDKWKGRCFHYLDLYGAL
jgi:hypothetical protein